MNVATKFFGSIWFLWLNIIVFACWISLNLNLFSFKSFDPYPFEFLTLSVSLEAIVLSVIVLIAQNKLQSDSDERSLLDLHINLLSESENTLMLKKLDRIERHLGITPDPKESQQLRDLMRDIQPEALADLIHDLFNKKDASNNHTTTKTT